MSVDLQPDLTVDGDPVRLSQVFANLLTNAAKYTPRGGDITIVGERSGDCACVRVCDTGIGIHPAMLPKVFDQFVQERQALDRSAGGLGLGLSIVRSLVDLHGGTVEVHSKGLGQGSEFRVLLPISSGPGPPVEKRPQPATNEGSKYLRVLLVDDNDDAARMLGRVLTVWGHVVSVAQDGPSALELVETFTPDVALLDIGLPAMDGYELARRLHAIPALAGVRLVALTGYGQARDRDAALAAGFHEHMVKPVDLDALEGLLAAHTLPGRSR